MTTYFDFLNEIPDAYRESYIQDGLISDDTKAQVTNWFFKTKGICMFHGMTGRGKTWTAFAIVNSLKRYLDKKNENCRFENEKERFDWKFCNSSVLYEKWRSNQQTPLFNEMIAKKMIDSDLLILDDIGLKLPTDGFLEFFISIVDRRYNSKKNMTLFTTNCSSKELTDLYSARFTSRTVSGTNILFEGPDLRFLKSV